jgi:hypothetical protein
VTRIIGKLVRRNAGNVWFVACLAVLTLCGSISVPPGKSYAASSPTNQQLNPQMVEQAGTSNVNYVLWSKSCGSSECFRLERINIADDTSSFVTVPPLSNVPRIAMGGLEQLDFANPLDGYELLDPGYQKKTQLYATFDGGRSWHHEDFIAGETVERITSTPSTFYIIGGVKCSTTNQLCLRWQLCSSPRSGEPLDERLASLWLRTRFDISRNRGFWRPSLGHNTRAVEAIPNSIGYVNQ